MIIWGKPTPGFILWGSDSQSMAPRPAVNTNNINWDEVLDWYFENVQMVLWSDMNQTLRAADYPAYLSLYNRLHDNLLEKFGVTEEQIDIELESRI